MDTVFFILEWELIWFLIISWKVSVGKYQRTSRMGRLLWGAVCFPDCWSVGRREREWQHAFPGCWNQETERVWSNPEQWSLQHGLMFNAMPKEFMTSLSIVAVLSLSCTLLFATPWTCKAPLSMTFPRQEYWNGLPFPSLGELPDLGIKYTSLDLEGGFYTTEAIADV